MKTLKNLLTLFLRGYLGFWILFIFVVLLAYILKIVYTWDLEFMAKELLTKESFKLINGVCFTLGLFIMFFGWITSGNDCDEYDCW